MKPSEIQEAFADAGSDTSSLKNLIYISLNNGKAIHVTEKMKEEKSLYFNGDLSLLIQEDNKYIMNTMSNFKPRKVKVYMNTEFIETLIFALDEEDVLDPKVYGGSEIPLAHNIPMNARPDYHIFGTKLDAKQPERNDYIAEEPTVEKEEVPEVVSLNLTADEGYDLTLDVDSYLSQELSIVEGNSVEIEGMSVFGIRTGRSVVMNRTVAIQDSGVNVIERSTTFDVVIKPEGIEYNGANTFIVSPDSVEMNLGEHVKVLPEIASQEVTYLVDKPEIAEISNGNIIFKPIGIEGEQDVIKVTIASVEDPSITKEIEIIVDEETIFDGRIEFVYGNAIVGEERSSTDIAVMEKYTAGGKKHFKTEYLGEMTEEMFATGKFIAPAVGIYERILYFLSKEQDEQGFRHITEILERFEGVEPQPKPESIVYNGEHEFLVTPEDVVMEILKNVKVMPEEVSQDVVITVDRPEIAEVSEGELVFNPLNIDIDKEVVKLVIASVEDPKVKLEVEITVEEEIKVDPEQIKMHKGNAVIGEGRSTENISTLEMITGGRKLHAIKYLDNTTEEMFATGKFVAPALGTYGRIIQLISNPDAQGFRNIKEVLETFEAVEPAETVEEEPVAAAMVEETVIDLGISQKTLAQGTTLQLEPVVTPEQKLEFMSTNEEVATVDANGLITVVGNTGQCRIKAVAEDGTEGYVIIKAKA